METNLKLEIKNVRDNIILLVMLFLQNFTLLACEAIVQLAIKLDEKISGMDSSVENEDEVAGSFEDAVELDVQKVTLKEKVVNFKDAVRNKCVDTYEKCTEFVKDKYVNCKEVLSGTVKTVKEKCCDFKESVKNKCVNAYEKSTEFVKTKYENCKKTITGAVATVSEKCSDLKDAVKSKCIGVVSGFNKVLECAIENRKQKCAYRKIVLLNSINKLNSTLCAKHGVEIQLIYMSQLCDLEIYNVCQKRSWFDKIKSKIFRGSGDGKLRTKTATAKACKFVRGGGLIDYFPCLALQRGIYYQPKRTGVDNGKRGCSLLV